jgi:predicted ATP-binding protein involved in virulence
VKLKRVLLSNYRGIRSAEPELGSRLTLLVGENGSGKSTILQAIALGLGEVLTHLPGVSGIGFRRTGDIHQQGGRLAAYARITLENTDGVSWDRTQRRDRSQSTTRQIPPGLGLKSLQHRLDQQILDPANQGLPYTLPVLVHYGVSRALLDVPMSRKGFPKEFSRVQALDSAFQATSSFRKAFAWFYYKENEEQRLQRDRRDFDVRLPELEAVRRGLQAMFPDLSEPCIKLRPLRFAVKLNGEEFDVQQLSDGYQTMIGLTLDLCSRFATANPQLSNPLEAEAIVLIDEVDLHLHPRWQMRVVQDLLRTFSNTQFILTTHSPVVLEGVNTMLKRATLAPTAGQLPDALEQIVSLPAETVRAYRTSLDCLEPLVDPEESLLHDHLIEPFNDIAATFDDLCDLRAGRALAVDT